MSELTTSGHDRISRPGGRPGGRLRARRPSVFAALAVGLVLVGCSGSDDASTTTAAAPGASIDGSGAGSSAVSVAAGTDSSPSSPAATDGAATTTTAAPTTTTIPPTTTTLVPLVTDGAIVLVANAAGVPGAAGQVTAALQAVGYAMKEPTDAAGYEESLDASKIYFLPQAEAAAQSLALALQINSVTRMPTPAPIIDAQVGLGDATVLVMLGKDLAGKDLPGLAGR